MGGGGGRHRLWRKHCNVNNVNMLNILIGLVARSWLYDLEFTII